MWFLRVCNSAVIVQINFGRERRVVNGVVASDIKCTSSTVTMNEFGEGSISKDKECIESSKKLALPPPSQREHLTPS